MEQISVKKLEEVLVVAGDDKQKQKEFYELLLSTEFYVAGSLEAEDGTEGILRLRHFQGEGRWIVPFFTQMEFVKDVLPEGTPLITIRGKELFGSIEKDATAVLNVGTDISKTFIPEEIADIASGRIFNYYSKRKSVIAFPFTFNLNMKAIPEEIETVLLFVFIVAVAPSGIPMFGLICPIGKSNRTGI